MKPQKFKIPFNILTIAVVSALFYLLNYSYAIQVGDRVIFDGKMGRVTKFTFVPGQTASKIEKNPIEIDSVLTTVEHVIEFIENKDPETRHVSDIPAALREFVVPLEKFNIAYITNGVFFHGTDSIEKAISMADHGFGSKKYFGRWGFLDGHTYSMPPDTGLYIATDSTLSKNYAGAAGGVFELTLKDSKNIRILDLRSATPQVLQAMMDEAALSHDQDLNLHLARKYGIDIIAVPSIYSQPGTKPAEMVLLNRGVLDFPSSSQHLPDWQWKNFQKNPHCLDWSFSIVYLMPLKRKIYPHLKYWQQKQ